MPRSMSNLKARYILPSVERELPISSASMGLIGSCVGKTRDLMMSGSGDKITFWL
jgi:hypothetical protein